MIKSGEIVSGEDLLGQNINLSVDALQCLERRYSDGAEKVSEPGCVGDAIDEGAGE